MNQTIKTTLIAMLLTLCSMAPTMAGDYQLPDTGIETCYDQSGNVIPCPAPGEDYYGQDAQYDGPKMAYQDNGDGTVTDLNTQLMWQQSDDGVQRQWQAACDYCDDLVLARYTDWRIPDRRELFSIVDLGRYNPTIDTNYFLNAQSYVYWSGSTYANGTNLAWFVGFNYGVVDCYNMTYSFYVRCVRSGP